MQVIAPNPMSSSLSRLLDLHARAVSAGFRRPSCSDLFDALVPHSRDASLEQLLLDQNAVASIRRDCHLDSTSTLLTSLSHFWDNGSVTEIDKELIWVGSSLKDLTEFPQDVKGVMGYASRRKAASIPTRSLSKGLVERVSWRL